MTSEQVGKKSHMSIASSITTAEALLKAGDIGRCELVRGELYMMTPASAWHGWYAMELARLVANHVKKNRLGRVFAAETGFVLSHHPDTVRAPDVAFVSKERLQRIAKTGFFPGAPDHAVEVLSPDDTASQVLEKVADLLNGGAKQVWIVDPKHRTIAVHRADRPARTIRENESLTEDDLLQGFSIRVCEVFE